MLVTLMDGRALSAGELSRVAGIAASTASEHLARLLAADLVAVRQQGRHRYYRLSAPGVAEMLEGMMSVAARRDPAAAERRRRLVVGPRDAALRRARVCYNHLAGEVAVALAGALHAQGALDLSDEAAMLTREGVVRLEGLGVEFGGAAARSGMRPDGSLLCRTCLDWSERRLHLGGAIGSAIYAAFLERGWWRRIAGVRTVQLTPIGAAALRDHFGLSL
jgi:DNA-binding transcriptional ArsR family regulator